MVSGPQPSARTSRYRCLRHHDGLQYFAIVELSADPTEDESVVVEAYTPGWHHYHEWEVACSAGIAYVLARAPGCWKITVHEIVGTSVDTRPTTVGYTAICAMAEATGHALPDDEMTRLDAFVFGGGSPGFDAVPDFEALRWNLA